MPANLVEIEIQAANADDLLRRFGLIGDVSQSELTVATSQFMDDFVANATEYPPESEANRPRINPPYYYERGVGVIYNSGYIRFSSEQLDQSWQSNVRQVGNEIEGRASTDVTYAPYVQARDSQAWFHVARDWNTVEAILEDMGVSPDATISVSAFGEQRNYFVDATGRIARFIEQG